MEGPGGPRLPSCRFSTLYQSSSVPPYSPYCSAMGQHIGNEEVAIRKSKRSNKTSYKHVPHKEKAPHLVQRRNARERRRVEAVNSAFVRLRKHVPHEHRSKRVSKVKTLRLAIEYIRYLEAMLSATDGRRTALSSNTLQPTNRDWLPVHRAGGPDMYCAAYTQYHQG